MAQIRVMGDDPAEVEAVLTRMREWLADCPDLTAGSSTKLGHRGGGGRFTFELMLARPESTPIRVEAERTDGGKPARARVERRPRRALPPGTA